MDNAPGAEMMSPDRSIAVYELAMGLVKKAGRMLLRAAYVRDDNPYIDQEVKGESLRRKED